MKNEQILYGVWQFSPIGDTCLGIFSSKKKAEEIHGKKFKLLKGIDREISCCSEVKGNCWVQNNTWADNKKYIIEITLDEPMHIG